MKLIQLHSLFASILLFGLVACGKSPDPPPNFAVESAAATSNTSVLVTFNRTVGDGGDNASYYEVSNPDLGIMAASVDGDKVTLTTSAQSDQTYTLKVSNVKDTDGNPINPASTATFEGDGLDGTPGDVDGDGLLDSEEASGWTVTVLNEDGTTQSFDVTSDPANADTDADGVLDGRERERRINPRQADTDQDGLTDFDEINRYASEPAQRDTDGDSLTDGQEVNDILSSPKLKDTDGDGLTDDDEFRGTGFDVLIAEIPELTLEFTSDPLITLDIARENGDDEETFMATLTEHESERYAVDISTTQNVTEESHRAFAGFDITKGVKGVIAAFSGGYEYNHKDTTSKERTAGWEETTRNFTRNNYQQKTRVERKQAVGGSAGGLTTTMEITNTGTRTFTINEIEIGAYIVDPDQPTSRQLLTSITSKQTSPLSPGKSSTINFIKTPTLGEEGINSDLTSKLLANPGSLMFEVSSYNITETVSGDVKRNVADLEDEILGRTSFVVIDFGNGDVERHLVATNVPRLLNGDPVGLPMSFVMDKLLDLENQWETSPNDSGQSTLTTLRNREANRDATAEAIDSDGFSTWYVYGTSESFNEENIDFEDINLKPRDAITLVYLTDADGDGLFAREELLYGSSDENKDSDGDGVDDLTEVRTGWSVTVAGSEPYQVYADPLARDSDSDGLDDLAEQAAGTDPLEADTDGDGLCDGPGVAGTYTEGCRSDSEPLTSRQFPKLTADDRADNDVFGSSVAISGNYAIVGAIGDDNRRGAAYVFELVGGGWAQKAKLTASDRAAGDSFGISVAISGDYAVVGAHLYGNRGAAYVFERVGGDWAQKAKLTASDGADRDRFGHSVAISGDYAVVGAFSDDDPNGGDLKGAAYVFERGSGDWAQKAKLTADDGVAADMFGVSVAISGDYAIIGADFENRQGAAYVFQRVGGDWQQQAKLTASNRLGRSLFGSSVAISGNHAVVGAYLVGNRGAAYVFERVGDNWQQVEIITADDGADNDLFGITVAISGNYAVVGAIGDDNGSGATYVFERGNGGWQQTEKFTAGDGDRFGNSVAVSEDYAIVGEHIDDGGRGAAYVFSR